MATLSDHLHVAIMGFELEGLIGRRTTLRPWRDRFPGIVECRLSGDLVLAPLTGPLLAQAARQFGIANPASEATRVAGELAALLSADGPVVHVSAFEFGDDGHEDYTLWAAGRKVWTYSGELRVRRYLADEFGFDAGPAFDIGRYRGESAAERWVANDAIPDSP